MSSPLLALGPHTFHITHLNLQTIKRTTEAKWPSIARFGTHPGRQFTGFGDATMTIGGLLFPEEFNDRDAYEALRQTQMAKKPVAMMGWAAGPEAAAEVFAQVVILKIEDTQSNLNRSGQGRQIKYTITLGHFASGGKPIGLFS